MIKLRYLLCQRGQKLGFDELEDLEGEPSAGSNQGEMVRREADRSKRLGDEDDQLGSRKRLRYVEPLRRRTSTMVLFCVWKVQTFIICAFYRFSKPALAQKYRKK